MPGWMRAWGICRSHAFVVRYLPRDYRRERGGAREEDVQPSREWYALIAREGKELPGRAGDVGQVVDNAQNHQDRREPGATGDGTRRLMERLDDGIACRRCKGCFDVAGGVAEGAGRRISLITYLGV